MGGNNVAFFLRPQERFHREVRKRYDWEIIDVDNGKRCEACRKHVGSIGLSRAHPSRNFRIIPALNRMRQIPASFVDEQSIL